MTSLEHSLSTSLSHTSTLFTLLERLRDSVPGDSLQRLFGDLLDTVQESFRLEEDCYGCETNLLL